MKKLLMVLIGLVVLLLAGCGEKIEGSEKEPYGTGMVINDLYIDSFSCTLLLLTTELAEVDAELKALEPAELSSEEEEQISFCKIHKERMKNYDVWVEEAKEIVSQDLGFTFDVEFFESPQSTTNGYVKENSESKMHINYARTYEKEDVYLIVFHEARHLWQTREGWEDESHISYSQRKEEIDANEYSEALLNK